MSSPEEEFARKIQRLRHTGVGGVQLSDGDVGSSARTRKGEPTPIKMKVDKGVVVATPVTKKNEAPASYASSSIKVFALRNMDKPAEKPQSALEVKPVVETQETEEEIIAQIIKLQKKLAALRKP